MKTENPKRYLFFGAHPDDPDVLFGGTALKLTRAGHIVKFVSVTNGDSGHFEMERDALAARRLKETQCAAKSLGLAEYEVFPFHDGELEVTVEVRHRIIRCIRNFRPDVVISHRLCDYHPDHRATAQLVLDSAYLLMVPLCCRDTPIPETIPVFAYSYDRFTDPRPLKPDAAVEIDSVLEQKCRALSCHESQFYEWLPWGDGLGADWGSKSWPEQFTHLRRWMERFRSAADLGRRTLLEGYGKDGAGIEYAELFEQSTYSRQVDPESFRRLFLP